MLARVAAALSFVLAYSAVGSAALCAVGLFVYVWWSL